MSAEKPKRTEKKPAEAEKVKRTDAELAQAHLGNVEKCIKTIEKWTDKLAKGMTSRKYPMTEDQTQFALEHLAKVNDKFIQTLAGKVETKTEFKLPQ